MNENERCNTTNSSMWVLTGGSQASSMLPAGHIPGDADAFVAERRALVVPILEDLKARLEARSQEVLPRSALGIAVSCMLDLWPRLVRYLDCPDLTPDCLICNGYWGCGRFDDYEEYPRQGDQLHDPTMAANAGIPE